MKKLYFLVYKQTYEGEVSFLKDPDFCRGDEKPLETYIRKEQTDNAAAFLPWMTLFKATAFAQAALLEQRDSIKHFVGAVEVDFRKILEMEEKHERG